ncbi:MAG: hypothetical protein ACXVBX_11400 [Flavisolibacter sp.]
MNNKIIRLISILSAPFLAIDLAIHGGFDNYNPTSGGGFLNFVYMTGWLLNVIALFKMHSKAKASVRLVFLVQIAFLCLADTSNVWSMIEPGSHNNLYTALDLFWPISNAFMLITGLTVLLSKKINGWQRYVPLLVGLWLPTGLTLELSLGQIPMVVSFIGIYSAVAWSMLGLSVYTSPSMEYREQAVLSRAAA